MRSNNSTLQLNVDLPGGTVSLAPPLLLSVQQS